MPITIRFDRAKPMASVEFMIDSALPDYRLKKPEAQERSHIQPVIASPGFKELVEAVRAAFAQELAGGKFEVLRISGIVCRDVDVYRPGILLIVEEQGNKGTIREAGRERITAIAEAVRERMGIW
jgi:hypothetical protein